MARTFDISNRLSTKNPTLKLDKDHVYEINTEKTVILQFTELQKSKQTENIDSEILKLLLGEKNAAEIEAYLERTPNYAGNMEVIMISLVAAVNNVTYEEMEKRFRKEQSK